MPVLKSTVILIWGFPLVKNYHSGNNGMLNEPPKRERTNVKQNERIINRLKNEINPMYSLAIKNIAYVNYMLDEAEMRLRKHELERSGNN